MIVATFQSVVTKNGEVFCTSQVTISDDEYAHFQSPALLRRTLRSFPKSNITLPRPFQSQLFHVGRAVNSISIVFPVRVLRLPCVRSYWRYFPIPVISFVDHVVVLYVSP